MKHIDIADMQFVERAVRRYREEKASVIADKVKRLRELLGISMSDVMHMDKELLRGAINDIDVLDKVAFKLKYGGAQ